MDLSKDKDSEEKQRAAKFLNLVKYQRSCFTTTSIPEGAIDRAADIERASVRAKNV